MPKSPLQMQLKRNPPLLANINCLKFQKYLIFMIYENVTYGHNNTKEQSNHKNKLLQLF